MEWSVITYFKPSEFDSADAPGSGEKNMNMDFVYWLNLVRMRASVPMKINSGYRTPAHNAAVGGEPNSAHLRGLAADIACPDMATRGSILKAAYALNVRRVGIAKTFVHLDNDPSLPAGTFVYPEVARKGD